ncbi:MAG TPA: isochorismate synthase [Bacilli bacterium]
MEIEPKDPLMFFAAGESCAGERFFWADPEKQVILAGIGCAFSIKTSPQHRYAQVEEIWQSTIENSVLSGRKLPGTGPLLFGGFAFDSARAKTGLWKSFPDTQFRLPQLMMSATAGRTFLTVNAFVGPEDRPGEIAGMLDEKLARLLRMRIEPKMSVAPDTLAIEETPAAEWMQSVQSLTKEIQAGQLEKAVLARELRVTSTRPFAAAEVLDKLREEQPQSYLFAYESGADCFVGASPERLVKREGNTLFTACLAGSSKRGKTAAEDDRLGAQLLQDKKNLREHHLVVQMIYDAMAQVCTRVEAIDEPKIYKLRDIQHLYTPITGLARQNSTILSVVAKLHPTPALGGFPREIALAKIREYERLDRGWYGAPIGWLDAAGDGEFAVAIRSALLQGTRASLFAGCGIVGDSDPESEYQETQLKFQPMLSALRGVQACAIKKR